MAVTDVGAFIVTTQFPVPVHAPDHPVNVDPATAVIVAVVDGGGGGGGGSGGGLMLAVVVSVSVAPSSSVTLSTTS